MLSKTQNVMKAPSLPKIKQNTRQGSCIYPEWLKNRSDFQKALKEYEDIEHKDVSSILQRPSEQRTSYEKQALMNWLSSIPFFSDISFLKLKELLSSFSIEKLKKGETLFATNLSHFLYTVASGKLLLKYSEEDLEITTKSVIVAIELFNSYKFPKSIVVLSDTIVLKLYKEKFNEILISSKLGEEYDLNKFIKNVEFFNSWSTERIFSLMTYLNVMALNKGDVLYTFKQPTDKFYIVKSGSVLEQINITLNYINAWPVLLNQVEKLYIKKNYLVELNKYEPGTFFGFNEVFSSKTRETQAISMQQTVVFALQADIFLGMLTESEKKNLEYLGKIEVERARLLKKKKNQVKDAIQKKNQILNALNVNLRPDSNIFKNPDIQRKMSCAKKILYKKIDITNKELKEVRSHTRLYDKNNKLIKRCESRDESHIYKNQTLL